MAGRKIGELGEWRHRVGVLDHEMAKADLPALHLYAVGGLAEIWHGIAGTRTEDLDVEVRNVTHMDSATQMLVAQLGRRWGTDPDWLNEQVATSRVLPVKPDPAPEAWYTGRKLRVDIASAPRLLAMKLRAGRPNDWPTVLTLAERLKVSSVTALRKVHDEAYAEGPETTEAHLNNIRRAARLIEMDRLNRASRGAPKGHGGGPGD